MPDLNEKLNEILNDPESMNRVRDLAESILSGKSEEENKGDLEDSIDIGKIMSIMEKLKHNSNDSRSQLLLSLKPHLSAERREKVDTALKLLKLIELLPLLKEGGII